MINMNDSINVCQVRTVRLLRLVPRHNVAKGVAAHRCITIQLLRGFEVKLKRILATIKDRITSEAGTRSADCHDCN